MPSLSEFAKNYKPKENKENAQSIEDIRQNFSQEENLKLDETIKDNWQKYENMSQDQLFNELFSQADKLKANGQFNYDALYNSIQNMDGYLSQEQKQNMLNLLQKLR